MTEPLYHCEFCHRTGFDKISLARHMCSQKNSDARRPRRLLNREFESVPSVKSVVQ